MIGKYIKELLKWDGYIEKASNSQLDHKTANAGNKNYTRFGRDFFTHTGANLQAQPWCMIYLNSVLVETIGLVDAKKALYGELYASCTRMVNVFKTNKAFFATSQVGDFVIFTDSKGKIAHVGLVLEIKNGKIYTIEGNTSSVAGVVDNGGMVRQKSYSLSYKQIYGYCRPNYKAIEVETVKDGWIKSADKWQYWKNNIQQKSTWVQSENKWDWYYLKSDGNMAESELLQIGAELFYFLNDGRMATTNDRGALV